MKRKWPLRFNIAKKISSPTHAGRPEKREARKEATEPSFSCNFFMHRRKRGQVLMPAFLKAHSCHVPSACTACSQYSCCKLSAVRGEEEAIWVEDKATVFRKRVSLDQTVLYHSRRWAFPCVITKTSRFTWKAFWFWFPSGISFAVSSLNAYNTRIYWQYCEGQGTNITIHILHFTILIDMEII